MTAADSGPHSPEPSRSVEIELKFDADDETPLPDLTALPGVASVGAAERRELDARYFDTAEYALAAAGYAVRRRSGGPDAGWHVKGPRVGAGRTELGWPLGESAEEEVPDDVRAGIADVTDADLRPIARILNSRTAYAVLSADGTVIAEFVDDRVTATDVRTGAVRAWREWEIELGPAASADPREFFAAVEAAVFTAGGRTAASSSKLARALGY
ncbi:CYTH domain-containing protein [Microbacterium sp. zg.B48]|uniref:CYTH domain-containing protein n=1 Tax=unclassified Microbacterium TaxID=2609290 RepID=UPI00214B1B3B|nr:MULTISPECIES: CYTH domain-containing protein [unclassified Microbacterium]MCR2763405.1 CYTH domain-containing protein [Microbacterium sp. zg.B48]MCR2809126.1 CYTH domain-containing protein [Microbacterium sp. zg.B185]WIM20279.1 CYTH domain-containing protein [Microbacterium sp. zg-B185]